MKKWVDAIKRIMDVTASGIAIIILGPLLIVIALLIFILYPGPVFFNQKRLGQYGKEFCIYKFRTMVVNAEDILKSNSSLYAEYVKNSFSLDTNRDPRVTKLGKFLRQTSLDELPQFFNVVKGDMSLVGPRPIVQEEIKHYDGQTQAFLSVKPGITGYWQVSGRDDIHYPERVDVEMHYISNHNVWLDIYIIMKTITSVVLR